MYKHFLITTDRTGLSDRAIADGMELAKALGARVTVLTVILPWIGAELSLITQAGSSASYDRIIDANVAKCLALAQAVAAKAGVACDTMAVRQDQAWRAIVETAEVRRCDLIVMASHGYSGLGAVLLGSETQKVLAHVKMPVLVHR